MATGPRKFLSGHGQIVGSYLYTTPEAAEKAIPAFIEACSNSEGAKSLYDLDREKIQIKIVPLQLWD
jgi:hypothetical protein